MGNIENTKYAKGHSQYPILTRAKLGNV